MSARLPAVIAFGLIAALLAGCATTGGSRIDDEARRRAADINTQLGIRYLQGGRVQLALRKLQKALEQDPGSSNTHMVMGIVYERLDEIDQAREHYARAVELDPKNPYALNSYGRFLCAHGQYEHADELFRRAADIALYPAPEVPLANAGLCALRSERPEQAETYFARALKINPRLPAALLNMARLRYREGDYLPARGYYQRYLAVAGQTAESLWLGVRIESELGNEDAVASYSLHLRNRFPDSDETRRLLEWGHDGKL